MKRILIRTAVLMLAALVLCISSCGRTYPAANEQQIVDFLSECGISVSGQASVKTVTVPQEFGDVYEEYNSLQKKQGFDLSGYKAREAQVYTFDVVSVSGAHADFTEAHVMVCDNIVIAADISSPALDGGMCGVR